MKTIEAKIYNREGKETGEISLPINIFGLPWNADLVQQTVLAITSNARTGTADAKDRSRVSGGGKKPWRQKGTGRARHGSSRSPLWKGGGVTHGPLAERNYDKKVNRKAKIRALFTVLSQKARDNEILFVESMLPTEIKTKVAAVSLAKLAKIKGFEKLAYRRGNRALLALPEASEKAWKSFRNLPTVRVAEARNLNPHDLLSYKYLIMSEPKASVAALEKRLIAPRAAK